MWSPSSRTYAMGECVGAFVLSLRFKRVLFSCYCFCNLNLFWHAIFAFRRYLPYGTKTVSPIVAFVLQLCLSKTTAFSMFLISPSRGNLLSKNLTKQTDISTVVDEVGKTLTYTLKALTLNICILIIVIKPYAITLHQMKKSV